MDINVPIAGRSFCCLCGEDKGEARFGDLSWAAVDFDIAVAGLGFCCLCGEDRGEGLLLGEDRLVGLSRNCLRCSGEVGDLGIDRLFGDASWTLRPIDSCFSRW